MAESALRQYEYGGDGPFGFFMPERREILSPEQRLDMGYTSTRRGPAFKRIYIPAKLGESETSLEYMPAYRAGKSALNAVISLFTDPPSLDEVKEAGTSALRGIDQYMRDQYVAGALGGTAYNPETGQVTEFDPTVAMVGGAPTGVQAVRAATPGSVVLGMVGSKNARYTPDQLEAIRQIDEAGFDTDQLFLHGTSDEIDQLSIGKTQKRDSGYIGTGAYSTPEPNISRYYSNQATPTTRDSMGDWSGPNTFPLITKKGNYKQYTLKEKTELAQKARANPEFSQQLAEQNIAEGYIGADVVDANGSIIERVNYFPDTDTRSAFDYSIPETTLRSGSKRGTGVAAASALTGDYRDRIIQEYPKSYKPAIIENYVSQGVDPRTFAAGAGDNAGDPRMGQLNILGGTTVNIGDQRIGDVPRIDLADYEGYPFFTSMSDRAAAGDVILDINGVPINVSRRGGQNYMLDPESGEFVWASDEDVVLKSKGGELSDTSFFKTAKDLKEKYGKDPLIVPWTMAPTGIDFSTQVGETMLSYARNSMSRGDLASLDKDVKEIIPDWPGIDNPDWVASFRNTTGNQRKAVENLLDRNYVDKGGITSGIARYANTDSDLRMARDGQLVNAGVVDTGRYPLTDSILVHPTYNTGLYGEGLGRIAGDIQVFELLPDARALMGIVDPLNPPRNALRALEMKPYGGVITESTLRAIEDRRR